MAFTISGWSDSHAQEWDYQWNASGSPRSWTLSSNWIPSTGFSGYPNGDGIYVYFSRPTALGGNQYVTLDANISVGRLDIGNLSSSGSFNIQAGSGGVLNFTAYDGGNAQLNQYAENLSPANSILAPVTLSASLDVTNSSTKALTIAGDISSATAGAKSLTVDGDVTISGNISDGAGAISLIKTGSGVLTLSSVSSSYTGDTIIKTGGLSISDDAQLGNGGNLIFDNGSSWGQLGVSTVSVSTGRTIELNGNVARIAVTPDLTFTVNGNVTGSGGILKRFAGALILNGSGNYTGNSTVEGGSFIVNGDYSASTGTITVNEGALLGGGGVFGGAAVVNGTLAAGNSIGTLSIGDLTIGSTGSLEVELGRSAGTPTSDQVHVTGEVTLASDANLELIQYTGLDAPEVGDIYWLVVNDGADAVSGTFGQLNGIVTSSLSEGGTFSWDGLTWQITYLANFDAESFSGGNDIALQVVPEASTMSMVLVFCVVLTLWRYRRHR
jgi:autotransporter-associated beta strand protein